jgi:hypothetical protein
MERRKSICGISAFPKSIVPPCLVPDRIWQGRVRTEIAEKNLLKETFGDFCHPDGVGSFPGGQFWIKSPFTASCEHRLSLGF